MDLISVIIPIYNAEKYLDRCISSIVKQTYPNLEIILIDDGSSDRCPRICDEWVTRDKRIKVIHQENGGISVARNTGVANSEGRYIMMVDSDDYVYTGIIDVLYSALIGTSSDLAICEFEKGFADTFHFVYNSEIPVEIIDTETALKRIYLNSDKALQYIAPWAKLYRRELFDGIQYPEGRIFEDIYVTHQILCRCKKVAVVPQKLSYYYQHPESIMNEKYHVGKLDYLEALENRVEFFRSYGFEELSHIAYDEYLHSLIWEYSRTRDILNDKIAMKEIVFRFRNTYHKGYSSKRYPEETSFFLGAFALNPELIIFYWRVINKLRKLFS